MEWSNVFVLFNRMFMVGLTNVTALNYVKVKEPEKVPKLIIDVICNIREWMAI